MNQIISILQEKTVKLDKFGDKIPQLKDFSTKHGINTGTPIGLALIGLSLIALYIQGWAILLLSLTVVYPSL